MLHGLLFRLRSLVHRRRVESELEDELRFHSEHQVEKHIQAGMTRTEALRRTHLDFGKLEQVKDDCRDERGAGIDTLMRDLQYGSRTLLHSPGFTTAALLTLALGIGANTAIFSVVYGILLRPLPFRDSAGLVLLNETTAKVGDVSVSYPNFRDWQALSRKFSRMAMIGGVHFSMTGARQPENISGLAVSPAFFSMTGIRPVAGRSFTADEEKPGTAPVVLLSYALWQSHFNKSSNAMGQTIRLNGRSFTVVGVLPREFRWTEKCDVMEPLGVWATGNDAVNSRGERGETLVMGRLAAGVTVEESRREMEVIATRLAREYPDSNAGFRVGIQPLREAFSGDARPAVLVLMAAALCVLLVACANVANLFLMRGAGRSREMALRMAIGASRGRIVRQILTESYLVALVGGVAGVGLALAGIPALKHFIPPETFAGANVDVNAPVLLFSAGLALLSVLLFGLAPALHATGANLQTELKEGSKATSTGGRNRWRTLLATGEVALALILLVGAGLMMKSLYRLLSVDSGFRPERVIKLNLSLRTAQYDNHAAAIAFWRRTLDGVKNLPGVESATLGTAIPLTNDHSRGDITVEGIPLPMPGSFPHPDLHMVSPGYEQTLGVRLLRGRGFTDSDGENSSRVAIVNALAAQRLFAGSDPVGKRFALGRPRADRAPAWLTIVGVVADTKMYGLANPARLEVYLPFRQLVSNEMALLVKSATDPAGLIPAIRDVVASIDKEQPVFGAATMQEVVNASIATERVTLVLLGLFSALALTLASIGIYAVISYWVTQRAKEIGIRMALGAQRSHAMRLVLAQGARIAITGIVIGSIAALCLTRLMAKLLYSVSAMDPATFGAVACALAFVAMLACCLPALRIMRSDPMIALRHE